MQVKKSNKILSYFLFLFSVVVSTTFFIFTLKAIFFIPFPTREEPIILYSNQLGTNLKKVFLKGISSAKKKLTIHSFALTDEETLALLYEKEKSLDEINVITDHRTLPSEYTFLKNKFGWKPIKSSGLMHEKIMLIDDDICYLGTANMTYESMKMHDNIVIGFYSKDLTNFLYDYTNQIEKKKKEKNSSSYEILINDQKIALWMLPFKGAAPVKKLIELIEDARDNIKISMFTLTHPDILQALVRKHKEGIKVKIFLDKTSFKGASSKAAAFLIKEGVALFASQGIQLLHHKMMVVDDKIFLIGSANWTQAAFKKNHDFFLVIDPLTKKQKNELNKVFSFIEKDAKKLGLNSL